MNNMRFITSMIERIFLVSWIFAVLWVKGYLWWLFGIAFLLFVVSLFRTAALLSTAVSDSQPEKPATKRRYSSAKSTEEEVNDSWREPMPRRSTTRAKTP